MSGVFGIFNQDGAPTTEPELRDMASLLTRRGPDGTGIWHVGCAGLGHTLLATTPELVFERQPLRDPATGCVITADVRLDNRDELLAALGLSDRAAIIGDAGLILAAYLAWGETCPARFLGDFAFVIWDPRHRTLFCARDQFGMRPFYYHHTPGRFLVFASEPKAILVLPQTPYRINEGRIADFLVMKLEGIDKTSTFFEEVYRLPPAHTLTAKPEGVKLRRYWTLEPGPELRLASNEAYAEAFLDVFREAVRCRLRSAGQVGSMLSGGMDSGSVVAVAREILAEEGRGPLPTFSAVGPDPETCVETRTIHAAVTMSGLKPHLIGHDSLDALMPDLAEQTWRLDEPFEYYFTLVRAVYLTAHRRGLKVMLDGVGGDNVLGEGSFIARLIRSGHWLKAYRQTVAYERFWGKEYPAWREFVSGVRSAIAATPFRHLHRRLIGPRRLRRKVLRDIRNSRIHPVFAARVRLGERLSTYYANTPHGWVASYGEERARSLDQPYLTVGRERYDRAASAVAVEPRDPFLDRRVVGFCLSLPGEQVFGDGWPKIILRRAMAGRLPNEMRWRNGKDHLGFAFTNAFLESSEDATLVGQPIYLETGTYRIPLTVGYVSDGVKSERDGVEERIGRYRDKHLKTWLALHRDRPAGHSGGAR